ncbi:MAG: hypothetical protein EAS52_02745 [Parapedobacter sp.]|nr:MAG: hypothetical protein EAS52_02745 [Parapedobacter sp.]
MGGGRGYQNRYEKKCKVEKIDGCTKIFLSHIEKNIRASKYSIFQEQRTSNDQEDEAKKFLPLSILIWKI